MNELIFDYLEDNIFKLSNEAKFLYENYDYHNEDKFLKKDLISTLKRRSQFKRALKEYKKLCENVRNEKYKNAIQEYRNHPEVYIEMITGKKLSLWQKLYIRALNKIPVNNIIYVKNNGRHIVNETYNNIVSILELNNGSKIECIPTNEKPIRGKRSELPIIYDEIDYAEDNIKDLIADYFNNTSK